jgi:hypothetical protein
MAWDFSTDADFQRKLDWMREGLRWPGLRAGEAARERFAELLDAVTAND